MTYTSARGAARKISAIQVVRTASGTQHMGLLTQIMPEGGLSVCGPSFNERTVQVKFGGALYFVLREDLERTLSKERTSAEIGSKKSRE